MNLEDHVGDIVRKARAMSNVEIGTAAGAAGMTESEFAGFEETGRASRPAKLEALAPLLGLHPDKLQAVAAGWTPAGKELGAWRELRCVNTESGGMAVNCYLIWDEVTREAALFDTGWDARPLFDLITGQQLLLRHLFITHGHADHIAALDAVRRQYPKVRLHRGSPQAAVDQRNRANDFIHLGSLRITNRDTPGHAEDGTTYVVGNWPDDAPHVAIVGDALFAGSIGRGNQSWELAKQKVRDQILSLPLDTLLCPGHGPLTTVGEERAHNPFFD
jgi:hydroxyacylglutathione hydrolase